MVPRGIEPRSPGFHSGAYIHSAKAPFVCNEYWLITISSSSNSFITNFADEERFELSTNGLTNRCSTIELFILSLALWASNSYLHPGALPVKRSANFLFCWPGEIRTHNLPIKSREHLSSWATSHFCCDYRTRTCNYHLVTMIFFHWIKSHSISLPSLRAKRSKWWLTDSNYQPLRYQPNALNHWAKSSIVAAIGLLTSHLFLIFVFVNSAPLHFEPITKAYETFELPLL